MKDRGYIIPRQKGEILPSSLTSYQLLYRISRNFSRGHELDNKRHEYPRVWRCLSSKRRRAPHKLLPSRDTQARKLYSFFVSISSPPLIRPPYANIASAASGWSNSCRNFLPPTLSSILDTGEDRRKSVLYGDERLPRAPLTSKRGIF